MCYLLHLSTTSDEDLTRHNNDLLRFEPPGGEYFDEDAVSMLEYENRWFVGSKFRCSCSFRHHHTSALELGFMKPVEWMPEDPEHIEATKMLYRVIGDLIKKGHRVDCIDQWADTPADEITKMPVNINEVDEDAFILFENVHFMFGSSSMTRFSSKTSP